MEALDLDAARAARREALGETPQIRLGGVTYDLPVEIPYRVAELMVEVSTKSEAESGSVISDIIRILFGDRTDEFMAQASVQDVGVLFERLVALYGVGPGESKASGASVANIGQRSRQTSKRPTPSTSKRPATARNS